MLRRELRASLIERRQRQHHGSFRWTYCTIDDLTRRHTPKAIEKALDGVAPTLGEIYMGILQGVPDDMVQAAASILQCLVSSLRQLTISELSEAVSFTFSDDFDEDDRLIEPEAVVHSLYSLVHYDLSSQRIELAHSSVRDFLTSPNSLDNTLLIRSKPTSICLESAFTTSHFLRFSRYARIKKT